MSEQPTQSIQLSIDSQFKHTVLVARAIRGICATTSLSQTEINRIELCVVEVLNNVIEHAYGHKSGHKIEVDILIVHNDRINITITDYGKKITEPLENLTAPFDDVIPDNPDTWACRGRGLSIVEQIMDGVDYQAEGNSNRFSMYFRFAGS